MAPRRNPKCRGAGDDGDWLTNKRAMAYGGGAEGRSTKGEVEEEYPQKEASMDTMETIMEREHQFETRSTISDRTPLGEGRHLEQHLNCVR